MAIAVINEVYRTAAVVKLMEALPYETDMRSAEAKYITGTPSNNALNCIIPYRVYGDGDTTAVDPKVGPTTVVDPVEYQNTIPMTLYLDKMIAVTGESSLYGQVDDEVMHAVQECARWSMDTRNTLSANTALYIDSATSNGIPANNAAWTFVTNNNTGATLTYQPVSDELVYLGSDTTSETARSSVAATETFADLKWLVKAHKILKTRGAEPIAMLGTEPIYNMMVPATMLETLKNSTDYEAELRALQVGGTNDAIMSGTMSVIRGFNVIEVPDDAATIAGAGAAGIDLGAVLFCGKNFTCKCGLPASQLPPGTNAKARMAVDEITEIRGTDAGDGFGTNTNYAPMFYVGYGINEPLAGFRMEFAFA